MKHSVLFTLILFVVLFATAAPSRAEHPFVRWALNGRTDSLAIAAERMAGTPEGRLAEALSTPDAAEAVPVLRHLSLRSDFPLDLQALIRQRLYGYAVIVGETELERAAANWLNEHPEEARPLFHGDLPEPPHEASWTIQIGAFGDPDNAQRLAQQQRDRGYTVYIAPLRSGGQTLTAVRVGRFDSQSEAEEFARRVYGAEGMSYRVVNVNE